MLFLFLYILFKERIYVIVNFHLLFNQIIYVIFIFIYTIQGKNLWYC